MQEINKQHTKTLILMIIGFAITIFSFLSLMITNNMLGIILILPGIGLIWYADKLKKNISNVYKNTYILPMLQQAFTNVYFTPETGLDQDSVYESSLFSKGNRYSSNDLVIAEYKGIPFRMSDVHIQNVTHNGKTTTTVEYFQGKWIIAKFPKSINGYLKVREKEFLGGDGTGLFSGLEKIETESIEFNKKFSIRTSDELEAFYILTPTFMETLLEIEAQIDGTIGFAFLNNEIHIGLYTHKDDFDIGMLDEYGDYILQQHQNEIDTITRLFDSLYENQYLYE
ncbi:MAG: DUF3137 domain-containing protein [Erysipelotrichales bacterium]|nr:DUF3137 domain-containing protein [Erysipelotrichales bacterium]